MTRVVIWVSDLSQSVSFYKDLFETDSAYLTETFASVSNTENEVLLHLLPEQYRSEPTLGEANPIKPVFSVSSIEHAKAVGLKHGTSFKAEAIVHGDFKYLDGTDPDRHVIQVAVTQK